MHIVHIVSIERRKRVVGRRKRRREKAAALSSLVFGDGQLWKNIISKCKCVSDCAKSELERQANEILSSDSVMLCYFRVCR